MPARLIQLLALAAGLYGTGAMIVLLAPSVESRQALAATMEAPAVDAPPVLPTVVVRPEPEIPTLATVTVRPDDDGAAAPAATDVGNDALDILAAHASSAVGLPGGGFNMPYYSFGRPLHRANRE